MYKYMHAYINVMYIFYILYIYMYICIFVTGQCYMSSPFCYRSKNRFQLANVRIVLVLCGGLPPPPHRPLHTTPMVGPYTELLK